MKNIMQVVENIIIILIISFVGTGSLICIWFYCLYKKCDNIEKNVKKNDK